MRIDKNAEWLSFEKLFDDDYIDRYKWFLFEFGKRITTMIHEQLLGKISQIKGSADYKKRLVVAELRDSGNRAWWAIIAKAKTLGQQEHDPDKTILTVVPRYELKEENPITEILVKYGPWTSGTIPFLPSLRQAMVVLSKASEKKTEAVFKKNKIQSEMISALMNKHDIEADSRAIIYEKLKIVPDWEVEALRLEFGLVEGGKPHWGPAIKWGVRTGLTRLMSEKDLTRALTDPSFTKHKSFKHEEYKMTQYDVKRLEKFQKMIRKSITI